jgi:hypothetical protein
MLISYLTEIVFNEGISLLTFYFKEVLHHAALLSE